jgi:hypothetical protein
MSFTNLFDGVLQAIEHAWGRIGLAFSRTFGLLVDGAVTDVGLWDVTIILVTSFIVLCVLSLFREFFELVHIGQEWVLEKIHNLLEGILNLVHRTLKRTYQSIRNSLKR